MVAHDPDLKVLSTADIFARHCKDLLFLARTMVGSPAVAEDIVQDAFASYLQKADEESIRQPFNYLFGTVRNLARVHLRKRAREAKVMIPYDSCPLLERVAATESSPERATASRQQLKLFQQAIAELPAPIGRAFRLYFLEGKTIRDISRSLNVSVGKAHSLVKDGLVHCERRVFDDRR